MNQCLFVPTFNLLFVFPAPGSPPRNVRARPLSVHTVMVTWDEPEITNGIIKVS